MVFGWYDMASRILSNRETSADIKHANNKPHGCRNWHSAQHVFADRFTLAFYYSLLTIP